MCGESFFFSFARRENKKKIQKIKDEICCMIVATFLAQHTE